MQNFWIYKYLNNTIFYFTGFPIERLMTFLLSIETHNASIIEFSRNSLALQNLVQEHSKEMLRNSKIGVKQISNDSSITLPYSDMAMSTHEV